MSRETNPRATVESSLPPLKRTCATFKGFSADEKYGEQVFQVLLAMIRRHRGANAKRFYTIREVAEFFGIGHATAQRVFRRLGREGALTLVRSSQTMIPARVSSPRFAVRGVVCMPIWLPGFLLFLDWRKWFSQLEEELAHYHFVVEPIFYKFNEEVDPDFVDRLLRFNPDYVLWSWPSMADLTTMHSITDVGLPLIFIHGDKQQFPGKAYRTSYERGLRQGLAEWAADGIREVVMPLHANNESACAPVLETGPLPCRFERIVMGNNSTSDFVAYLSRLAPDRRTGVVFGDDLLYVHLCTLVPDAMLEFISRRRVMVLRQATIPLGKKMPSDITVDALLYPWRKLARRIATDLGKSRGDPPDKVLLEAEWRPKIPLTKVVQTSFTE